MIKIFNAEKEFKLSYTKELELKIEHVLSNGDKTLSFLTPIDSKLTAVLEEEGYIETKDHCFVIKGINSNFKNCNVIAKLNVEELEGKFLKKFEAVEATAKATINSILVNTGWSVGYSNVKKKRTTRRESKNAFELIQVVKKIFNCDIVFDTKNKQILIYDNLGSYKGEYIRENMNLTNITAQSDSYDFYTRLEAEGKEGLTFSDINNGKSYVEDYSYSSKVKTFYWKDERYTIKENLLEDAREKLKELSKPRKAYTCDVVNLSENITLGDTIEIVSKRLNIKEKQRVIKYIEYPDRPEYNYVELSNNLVNLEDMNNRFEESSKTIEDVTNADGTINIEKVSGLVVRVTELTADKVSTSQLNAVTAEFGTVIATKADITIVNALKANVTELTASKADIVALNALSATIGSVQAEVGNIKTLVNGNLTSDNIHSLVLTSSKVTVENGFIKNAMIDNLDVSKINGGIISTEEFIIKSADGGIEIVGSTQQFKDSQNRVRLQLGKDSQGNFNFILIGEDGTSVLLDHTGLKRNAIADGLIINNMLGQGAVTGDKVNIGSLIQEVNKDNNTSTIKATKIQLDKEGQSLDIAFNTLKTNVNNIQIGGRNLIPNSNFKYDLNGWTAAPNDGTITVTSDGIDNKRAVKITRSNYNGYSRSYIHRVLTGIKVRKGDTFTLSAWVKSENLSPLPTTVQNEIMIRIDGLGDIASVVIDTNGEWKKISSTYTIEKLTTEVEPVIYALLYRNGTIWVTDLKLEYGNKATDWTAAPEDIENRIESNSTNISLQQGKIEALISDTSIVEDGTTKKLKDAYASLKLTVNGLNSTVGSHTTNITKLQGQITAANSNISSLSGKVQTVESKQSQFTQDLSTITQRVTSAETNVVNVTNIANSIKDNLDIEQAKVSGELLPQGYKANDGKGYFIYDNEPASRLTFEKNRIKIKNKMFIRSDFIRVDSSKAIHWLIEGTITNNNRFYFGIERYDKNKRPVNGLVNDGTVYFIDNYFTGQRKGIFYNDRKDTAYIKLRILNDWNSIGDSATAEITYISLEQNSVSLTAEVTTTNNKVAELKTNLDGITQKVSSTETNVANMNTSLNTSKNDISSLKNDNTTNKNNISSLNTQIRNTNNKVASIETTVNGISSKVSKVESSVTTINGNITSLQNRVTSAEQKITAEAIINTVTTSSITSTGKMLYIDPTFKYGLNGVRVYNNSNNGVVTINRISKPSDCPTTSTHILEIKTTGTGANPGHGGFYFGNQTRANAIFIYKFTAKVPKGVPIAFATNSLGDGNKQGWITDNKGTGSYKEYVYKVQCGTSGSFSSTGFFYLNGGTAPITWYLASATVYDLSDVGDLTGELSSLFANGAVLNTVSTITDKNGFTVNNGAITVRNKAGQVVLSGNTNGDLTFNGYLVGKDQQVKLIGDTMKIDGRNGALRFQYDSKNYLYIHPTEGIRYYTTNTYNLGITAPAFHVASDGHFSIYTGGARLKLLKSGGQIQSRRADDSGYASVAASDFYPQSSRQFKCNIKDTSYLSFTNIVNRSMIREYNLKADVEEYISSRSKGRIGGKEITEPDIKLGVVVEELPLEIKRYLVPNNSEGISLYNMTSILWGAFQEQQKKIQFLEYRIKQLETA